MIFQDGSHDDSFTDDSTFNAISARLAELLNTQADSLVADRTDYTPILEGFTLAQADEARDLMQLATRVREALTPVDPSGAFVERLKGELTGTAQATLLVRWRKLPAHYQLAAKLGGLTITAGIMLLAARRGLSAIGALQRRGNQSNPAHSVS